MYFKVKQFFLLIFILLLLPIKLFCQHQNILIDATGNPEEPSIFINPKNTKQIVAGANINKVFYSDDSGLTWKSGKMSSSFGVWGDPVILVDTSGNFYFFHLSYGSGSEGWLDRIVCQKLNDFNSKSWNDGSFMGSDFKKDHDKQWTVVNPKTNEIYSTWTVFDKYDSTNPKDSSNIHFSKSSDGGMTWSKDIRINELGGDCLDSDNTTEGAVPSVGPNGEIYVAWSNRNKIWFDKSTDNGTTWLSNDVFVANQFGGWDYSIPGISRCNGLPITVCDLSNSAHRGTIYVNWTDQKNGVDDTDVWLCKSNDGGNTWSEPKRVNDDEPGKHQFFTWMSIDQTTGYLYFVYYDRRRFNDNKTDVYMALSKDGGDSFVNFRISESPFIPDANVFFGDYNNLSVQNGVIRPIWTRMDNGITSVWTAIVDETKVKNEDISKDDCENLNLFPNPTKNIVYYSYKIRKKTNVRVELISQDGKMIHNLVNNIEQEPNMYVIEIPIDQYNISNGTHFIRLTENGITKTKKLIVQH